MAIDGKLWILRIATGFVVDEPNAQPKWHTCSDLGRVETGHRVCELEWSLKRLVGRPKAKIEEKARKVYCEQQPGCTLQRTPELRDDINEPNETIVSPII